MVRYPEAGSASVDGAGVIRRHMQGRQRALMMLQMQRPAPTTETTTRARGAHRTTTPAGAVPRYHLQLTSTHTRTPSFSCTPSSCVLARPLAPHDMHIPRTRTRTRTRSACHSESLSKRCSLFVFCIRN
jgi:hypothetical protein